MNQVKHSEYLNPQDVEVADEVPGWFSIFIHPQETITCSVVDCISWRGGGHNNHMTSMAITMAILSWQLAKTATETLAQDAHLVSRRSRIWAVLLVWRRRRRWAWWGTGRGWQSGSPRCTLSARTESRWGRTTCSRCTPATFDRRRSAERTDTLKVEWCVYEDFLHFTSLFFPIVPLFGFKHR